MKLPILLFFPTILFSTLSCLSNNHWLARPDEVHGRAWLSSRPTLGVSWIGLPLPLAYPFAVVSLVSNEFDEEEDILLQLTDNGGSLIFLLTGVGASFWGRFFSQFFSIADMSESEELEDFLFIRSTKDTWKFVIFCGIHKQKPIYLLNKRVPLELTCWMIGDFDGEEDVLE